jgi:CBS domain-containing protein
MKVREVMTRQVELASPDDTLEKAAGRMAELDHEPPRAPGKGGAS